MLQKECGVTISHATICSPGADDLGNLFRARAKNLEFALARFRLTWLALHRDFEKSTTGSRGSNKKLSSTSNSNIMADAKIQWVSYPLFYLQKLIQSQRTASKATQRPHVRSPSPHTSTKFLLTLSTENSRSRN
jgi:hypothetical protein